MTANRLKGEATLGFFDDTGADVREVVLSGNVFTATKGQGAPLRVANTQGRIGDNQITGAYRQGVGYRWTTISQPLSPGQVRQRRGVDISLPVIDARPGDDVTINPLGMALPDGIILTARATSDAVVIRYDNVSDRPIHVPAHDGVICVTR